MANGQKSTLSICNIILLSKPLNYRIVGALEKSGRDVKAHIIRRALQKSQFIDKTGEIEIEGGIHSQYSFTTTNNH